MSILIAQEQLLIIRWLGTCQVSATSRAKNFRSKSEQVWQDIIRLVEEHRLAPGGRLPSVRELASSLGVNPTLIRSALLYAQAHGAIRILPRAGAFLQTTSTAARALTGGLADVAPQAIHAVVGAKPENVLEILDTRRLIEVELAGRAAERRRIEDLVPARKALESMFQLSCDAPRAEFVDYDIRFHVAIARLAGNRVMARIQETLMELLRPQLNDIPRFIDNETRSETDRTHAAIYSAVVEGSAERARNEMRAHLNIAYDGLLGEIRRVPAPLPCEDGEDAA
ncbi:MAG: FadR/GntR family transcriptional regulator [Planctomycetaceae bacterium]